MTNSLNKAIHIFINELNILIDEYADNHTITLNILSWLDAHQFIFRKNQITYGCLEYLGLNIDDYPIDYYNNHDLIQRLKFLTTHHQKASTFMMILRDILESLFYIESPVSCPNHGSGDGGMIIIKANQFLYECRTCGCIFTMNLSHLVLDEKQKFFIPTLGELQQNGLLDNHAIS